jgi:hypothetical protein
MAQFTEQERLEALEQLGIMDSEPESDFNDLVSLASDLCQSPISILTLLDEHRQWFKAIKGLPIKETARSIAFCDKALMQDDIFVVSDAANDPRFSENPLVTEAPFIRFYAGALVHSPEGHKLGTLCIIDTSPRELSWKEANILSKLARQGSQLIELRTRRLELEKVKLENEGLRKEKELMRFQFQRLAHLSMLQNDNLAAFFDNGMDAIKTGRFTKKEIAEITEKAADHRGQIKSFNEALALLANYRRHPVVLPAAPVRITDLCLELFEELGPLVRTSGNKVVPLIQADTELRQDHNLLYLLFKTLLGGILGAIKGSEITLLAKKREDGVEFQIHIPDHNLVDPLQRFLPDSLTLGLEHLSGKSFHVELALLKDLVFELGGTKTLHKLGNRGTAIDFFLPHRI